MKLAVISDLHGNYYVLAKVLAFLRSQDIDGIIGLGDFVTDGPFPQWMMTVLREMQDDFPCYLVRGNREEYLLENIRHPQNWKRQVPRQADFWIIRFGILMDRIWNFSNICRQTVFWSEK